MLALISSLEMTGKVDFVETVGSSRFETFLEALIYTFALQYCVLLVLPDACYKGYRNVRI
jgi:hypothetical protein